MSALIGYLHRTLLPLISIGNIAWLLHRLTGVALFLYLITHFISIGRSRQGNLVFDTLLESYRQPLFRIVEGLIIMAVAYHLFNGLRIIAIDFFSLSHKQKLLFWLAMGACVIVLIGVSYLFIPEILSVGRS